VRILGDCRVNLALKSPIWGQPVNLVTFLVTFFVADKIDGFGVPYLWAYKDIFATI